MEKQTDRKTSSSRTSHAWPDARGTSTPSEKAEGGHRPTQGRCGVGWKERQPSSGWEALARPVSPIKEEREPRVTGKALKYRMMKTKAAHTISLPASSPARPRRHHQLPRKRRHQTRARGLQSRPIHRYPVHRHAAFMLWLSMTLMTAVTTSTSMQVPLLSFLFLFAGKRRYVKYIFVKGLQLTENVLFRFPVPFRKQLWAHVSHNVRDRTSSDSRIYTILQRILYIGTWNHFSPKWKALSFTKGSAFQRSRNRSVICCRVASGSQK